MKLFKFLEHHFEKIEKIYIKISIFILIIAFIFSFALIIIDGIDSIKKAPFKCIENNLYIDGKSHKLINQNKKCIVINETIYIHENNDLKRAYWPVKLTNFKK